MATATAELRYAISDTQSTNFQAVSNDASEALSEWSASYSTAGALRMELQVNNAQLQLGISSEAPD